MNNRHGQFSLNYLQTFWRLWLKMQDILRLLPEKSQTIASRGFEISKLKRMKWDDFLPYWIDWVILPFQAGIASTSLQTCLCQRGRGIRSVWSLAPCTAFHCQPMRRQHQRREKASSGLTAVKGICFCSLSSALPTEFTGSTSHLRWGLLLHARMWTYPSPKFEVSVWRVSVLAVSIPSRGKWRDKNL